MESNGSKAFVIDANNEYSIVGMRHNFPSILNNETYEYINESEINFDCCSLPTTSYLGSRSEDEIAMLRLANIVSTSGQVFSLVANVLETFGESSNDKLRTCLQLLKGAKYFCEGAAIVLNMSVDNERDEAATQLNKIFEEIRDVRNDIRQLERSMKWATTRMQYADICTMIVTGVEFCQQIQCNAGNESLKHDYEERLKELCTNQRFTLALRTLIEGITGKGDFRIDILQLIYEQTKGSRPVVMRMAGRFVQLLTGGMITMLIYETLMRGEQSAKQFEEAVYADHLKEVEQCYKQVIQRCVDESKENMANDVDTICAEERQLEDLLKEIPETLNRKYDWLQFQCVAYKNGVVHCRGSRIEKHMTVRRANIICFYTSRCALLPAFNSSEKTKIHEIIFKRQLSLIKAMLLTQSDRPDGYNALINYLNLISEKRQCWVVGASAHPEVLHEAPEGSYQHLIKRCGFTNQYCFVSMFFQEWE